MAEYIETEIDLREVLETPHMARPVDYQGSVTRVYVKTDAEAETAAEWLKKRSIGVTGTCKPATVEVISERTGWKITVSGCLDLIYAEEILEHFRGNDVKMFKRELVTEYAEGVPEWEK